MDERTPVEVSEPPKPNAPGSLERFQKTRRQLQKGGKTAENDCRIVTVFPTRQGQGQDPSAHRRR